MIDENTITIETMQLRERLQIVEIGLEHARDEARRVSAASGENIAAMNNRLTSQYQRIAKLEDARSRIIVDIQSMQNQLGNLSRVSDRLEKQERRMAILVEIVKFSLPLLIVALAVLDRTNPGALKALGL